MNANDIYKWEDRKGKTEKLVPKLSEPGRVRSRRNSYQTPNPLGLNFKYSMPSFYKIPSIDFCLSIDHREKARRFRNAST